MLWLTTAATIEKALCEGAFSFVPKPVYLGSRFAVMIRINVSLNYTAM